MKGFVQDIEGLAHKNDLFRRVLYTAKNCQLVLMTLKSKEEIGVEVHNLDQFFRVEEGSGEAVLDGVSLSEILCVRHTIPAKEFYVSQSQSRRERQNGTAENFSAVA